MISCTVDGCINKHLANGLCRKHYLRMYKHGRIYLVRRRDLTSIERIKSKIVVQPNGCWVYTGKLTKKGYAHVRDGTMRFAHVIMFEEKNGPLPEGYELHHDCRNRACCNPDHLQAYTHVDHMALHAKEKGLEND